jgi:hypothetical protein
MKRPQRKRTFTEKGESLHYQVLSDGKRGRGDHVEQSGTQSNSGPTRKSKRRRVPKKIWDGSTSPTVVSLSTSSTDEKDNVFEKVGLERQKNESVKEGEQEEDSPPNTTKRSSKEPDVEGRTFSTSSSSSFSRSFSLESKKRMKHPKSVTLVGGGNKKHVCDRCGRSFGNGHALGGHKKYCGKPQFLNKTKKDNKKKHKKKYKKKKKKKNHHDFSDDDDTMNDSVDHSTKSYDSYHQQLEYLCEEHDELNNLKRTLHNWVNQTSLLKKSEENLILRLNQELVLGARDGDICHLNKVRNLLKHGKKMIVSELKMNSDIDDTNEMALSSPSSAPVVTLASNGGGNDKSLLALQSHFHSRSMPTLYGRMGESTSSPSSSLSSSQSSSSSSSSLATTMTMMMSGHRMVEGEEDNGANEKQSYLHEHQNQRHHHRSLHLFGIDTHAPPPILDVNRKKSPPPSPAFKGIVSDMYWVAADKKNVNGGSGLNSPLLWDERRRALDDEDEDDRNSEYIGRKKNSKCKKKMNFLPQCYQDTTDSISMIDPLVCPVDLVDPVDTLAIATPMQGPKDDNDQQIIHMSPLKSNSSMMSSSSSFTSSYNTDTNTMMPQRVEVQRLNQPYVA